MNFYIDEVRTRALANPDTFKVPDMDAIECLEPGDFVKLILIPKNMPKGASIRGERPWVKITEKNGDTFHGVLDNDPVVIEAKIGDPITFKAENIAGIHFPPK